jgi:hypothetical protein
MDGFLGGSTQLHPGPSEYRNIMQICPFDSASAGSKPTDDNSFFYRNTAALKIYSWIISSEVHFNWSQLRGHTIESKYVEHDSVPMPSWITHGRFLECSLSMVLAKWSAESKSVSLGLRRFETCRWQLFVYRNTPCNSLMDSFLGGSSSWSSPRGDHYRFKICFSWIKQVRNLPIIRFFFLSEHTLTFSVLRGLSNCSSRVLRMWLPQQNSNLSLVDWAGSKPGHDKVFSIGTCYTPCHSLMDDVLSSVFN